MRGSAAPTINGCQELSNRPSKATTLSSLRAHSEEAIMSSDLSGASPTIQVAKERTIRARPAKAAPQESLSFPRPTQRWRRSRREGVEGERREGTVR